MKVCSDCGCETWEPGDPSDLPSFTYPVVLPGQRHKSTCPRVPQLSAEDREKLTHDLSEMDKARRRAEVESRNYFIG